MKLEKNTNLWDYYDKGHIVIVPTNGVIRKDGTAAMGKGVALDAANKLPELPKLLADHLKAEGNRVGWFPEQRIITFPTKEHWKNMADIGLLTKSAIELHYWHEQYKADEDLIWPVYLPQVGTGLGGLNWIDVRGALEAFLDDSFVAIVRT